MKRLVLVCLAGLAAIPPYAALAGQMSDNEAIKILYVRMRKAMKDRDAKTIQSLMTDVSTVDGKTMTVKESMAVMESVLKRMKKVNEYKTEIKSCEISGKTAKLTVDYLLSAVMIQKGKPHDLVSKGTNTETLVKTPRGWRLKTVTTVKDETTMDGKTTRTPAAAPVTNPHKPASGKAHT